MSNKNRWEGFRLLHEEVAVKDLFSHQPHQKVADSLADLIKNDEVGATIGIEGSWGGGKSTVLNLFRKALTVKAFFVLFDAWAHEERCIRRVFLETVIGTAIKAIDSGELKGDIKKRLVEIGDIIAGRKNSHTITSTRKPTWTGLLAVLVSFFVAIEVALVSICKTDQGIDWPVMWTILGILAGIIVVIAIRAVCLMRSGKSLKAAETWALVEATAKEEIKKEVSEDEERTSIEFEKYFSEVMELINSYNPDFKIIIAIDNLDRIEGSKSLALWSTLQTFLQKRSEEVQEYWFKKLWVLVPYDANGLESVWSADGSEESKAKAKSFMDKAFQVRVEVPRPVMADWEDFAEENVGLLFNKQMSSDAEDIVRMLKVTRNALSSIPTPREIKNYVNQVAVFRNQFCAEIETKTIAYYVIKRFVDVNRYTVEDIRVGLIDKTFPDSQDLPYLPERVAEQLSGILFDVPPKDGKQLLLEPSIADALENYKIEDLKSIILNHEDGAWMAFDSYVRRLELWKDATDIRKFLTSVSCVFKCGYEEQRLRTFADVCRDYISRLCKDDSGNLKSFFDSGDNQLDIAVSAIGGLTALLGTQSLAGLNMKLASTLDVIVADDEIEKFQLGKSASHLFEAFAEESKKRSIIKAFTVDKLRQFSSTLPNLEYHLAKWIVPVDSLVGEINASIRTESQIPPYLGRAVKYVIESGIKADWTATIEAIKRHVQFNNGRSSDVIPTRRALDILLFIIGAYKDKYVERIRPLLKEGSFYNFVAVNAKERSEKAALLLMCCDEELCSHVQPVSHVGNSQDGVASINAVLNSEDDEATVSMLNKINEFGVESAMREFKYATKNHIFGAMVRYGMDHEAYSWFNLDEKDPLDAIWLYSEHLKISDREDKTDKLHSYMDYLASKFNSISVLKQKGFSDEDFKYCSELIRYYLTQKFDDLKDKVILDVNKLSGDDYCSNLLKIEFRGLLGLINEHNCTGYLGIEYFKSLHKLLTGRGDCLKERDEFIAKVTGKEIRILVEAMKRDYVGMLSKAIVETIEGMVKNEKDKIQGYYDVVRDVCQIEDFSDSIIDSLSWEGIVNNLLNLLPVAADLIARNKETVNIWVPSDAEKGRMAEPLQKVYLDTSDSAIQAAIVSLARYYGIELQDNVTEPTDDGEDSPAGV